MIQKLSVSNYAIIDSVEIPFSEGFNVITGETGAGKSLMVEALGLAMGSRADSSAINDVSKKCTVELEVEINADDLELFFNEHDLDFSKHCILRREITSEGKSRAFINDTPVTLNVLKSFSERIVSVHSQHQNLLAENASYRLTCLDQYAGNTVLLAEVAAAYHTYTEAKEQLAVLQKNKLQLAKEADYNSFLMEEFEKVELRQGLLEELEAEQKRLTYADMLASNMALIVQLLDNENQSVLSALSQIKQLLSQAAKMDSSLLALDDRLGGILLETKDILYEIEKYSSEISSNPNLLMDVDNRLSELYRLLKKHNVESILHLIEIKEKIANELNLTNTIDEAIERHTNELAAKHNDYLTIAKKLHQSRKVAAKGFSDEITEIIKKLGMDSGLFRIEVVSSETVSPNGMDAVQWTFQANKGYALSEVEKAASGGELSRIMLAVKAVLARKKELPSLILDEIDQGVSGEIAARIAKLMKESAKGMQVISITHLPQVAALADKHVYIFKSETNNRITTAVKVLSSDECTERVAAMLSDGRISQAALNQARELINA